MTQIQEPIQILHSDPMLQQMNQNLNIMNPMNIPQMIPTPLNLPINGNFPMAIPVQIPNNIQNQQNIDKSNYIFFNLNNIYYFYRKT